MRSVSDVFWFWEKSFVSGRICKVATDEVAQNQRKFNRYFQERVRIQLWKGENYLGSSPMAPSNDHLPGRKNFEKGRSTSGRTLGRPCRGDLSYSKNQTGNFINHVMFQVKKVKFKKPTFRGWSRMLTNSYSHVQEIRKLGRTISRENNSERSLFSVNLRPFSGEKKR